MYKYFTMFLYCENHVQEKFCVALQTCYTKENLTILKSEFLLQPLSPAKRKRKKRKQFKIYVKKKMHH